jgi:ArsR family transcriptional regulator
MDHVQFFKCLSDETRLSIVMLIAENEEQCVCDLTDKLQVSQPRFHGIWLCCALVVC